LKAKIEHFKKMRRNLPVKIGREIIPKLEIGSGNGGKLLYRENSNYS